MARTGYVIDDWDSAVPVVPPEDVSPIDNRPVEDSTVESGRGAAEGCACLTRPAPTLSACVVGV